MLINGVFNKSVAIGKPESGKCAKLYTVAASNNKDHSPHMLIIMFNRLRGSIGRYYTLQSLYYCLFAPHIYMGVVLCTYPVCGELHFQRNANQEVATRAISALCNHCSKCIFYFVRW